MTPFFIFPLVGVCHRVEPGELHTMFAGNCHIIPPFMPGPYHCFGSCCHSLAHASLPLKKSNCPCSVCRVIAGSTRADLVGIPRRYAFHARFSTHLYAAKRVSSTADMVTQRPLLVSRSRDPIYFKETSAPMPLRQKSRRTQQHT